MNLLNHTHEELDRIKQHLILSFDNDVLPLFENSQNIGKKSGIFHFGIVREVMVYIELCGAIYEGWQQMRDGEFDTRKVTTSEKAISFIKDVLGKVDQNYKINGLLFYVMFRHGSTHLNRPHRVKSKQTGNIYTWKYYSGDRNDVINTDGGILVNAKHLELISTGEKIFELPVSMSCICEDTRKGIEIFLDDLISIRRRGSILPDKQRRALTFIAEGIIERGDL